MSDYDNNANNAGQQGYNNGQVQNNVQNNGQVQNNGYNNNGQVQNNGYNNNGQVQNTGYNNNAPVNNAPVQQGASAPVVAPAADEIVAKIMAAMDEKLSGIGGASVDKDEIANTIHGELGIFKDEIMREVGERVKEEVAAANQCNTCDVVARATKQYEEYEQATEVLSVKLDGVLENTTKLDLAIAGFADETKESFSATQEGFADVQAKFIGQIKEISEALEAISAIKETSEQLSEIVKKNVGATEEMNNTYASIIEKLSNIRTEEPDRDPRARRNLRSRGVSGLFGGRDRERERENAAEAGDVKDPRATKEDKKRQQISDKISQLVIKNKLTADQSDFIYDCVREGKMDMPRVEKLSRRGMNLSMMINARAFETGEDIEELREKWITKRVAKAVSDGKDSSSEE